MKPEEYREFRTAIDNGNIAAIARMVEFRPEYRTDSTPFGTWLHVAASGGCLAVVRTLLNLGFDINARGGVADATALHRAASNGHYHIVDYLLKKGAVLEVDTPHRNPLFAAIVGGHMDVVRLLLKNGIDYKRQYTTQTMQNMDALALAEERGEIAIMRVIRDHIANQ